MLSRLLVGIACFVLLASLPTLRAQEVPEKTTICEMMAHPAAWNRKLVQVTGFASHGFEDSGFRDMDCDNGLGSFWMEYGGRRMTGTMSTVSTLARERTEPVIVGGIPVPLEDDGLFRRFDEALHRGNQQRLVHATVIARFFAKDQSEGKILNGYGHLGCCSLLLIQRVVDVDATIHPGLDYRDDPVTEDWGCDNYTLLTDWAFARRAYQAQQDAEDGKAAFAFSQPEEVARKGMTEYAHEAGGAVLKRIRKADGRVVYRAKSASGGKYVVTVSRPYILWYVATDPKKIAWSVLSVVRSCD